jgi:hypothetical protein
MKKIIYILVLLTTTSCSSLLVKEEIHDIRIIEFYKDKTVLITIDEYGIACINNDPKTCETININEINKNFTNYKNDSKVIYEKGNDFALPEKELDFNKDLKSIYVRVTTMKDYKKDFKLINKSCYTEKYINVDKDYRDLKIYDLIGYKNLDKLKKIIGKN